MPRTANVREFLPSSDSRALPAIMIALPRATRPVNEMLFGLSRVFSVTNSLEGLALYVEESRPTVGMHMSSSSGLPRVCETLR